MSENVLLYMNVSGYNATASDTRMKQIARQRGALTDLSGSYGLFTTREAAEKSGAKTCEEYRSVHGVEHRNRVVEVLIPREVYDLFVKQTEAIE